MPTVRMFPPVSRTYFTDLAIFLTIIEWGLTPKPSVSLIRLAHLTDKSKPSELFAFAGLSNPYCTTEDFSAKSEMRPVDRSRSAGWGGDNK